MTKSYSVTYGNTHNSYEIETNDLKVVEKWVNLYKNDYYSFIDVYSKKYKDFIYYKRILTDKPEKDMLNTITRDLRTKTGKILVK